MAKTRRLYGWALRIPGGDPRLRGLSQSARIGLDYARRLAESARERRRQALFERPLPERLTVKAIARDEDVSPVEIHRLIKQARIELFGKNLSDSAIYTRLRSPQTDRECAEPGCGGHLPRGASLARRYCDEHRGGAARVRRHRRSR